MPVYSLRGAKPTIHRDAFVHPDAVVIGNVTIGAESSVWPTTVLRGDEGYISIGERTSIQDGSIIHTVEDSPTIIGDDCVIGHLVHMEGCTVESGVLIGSGSIVLPRCVIRSGAIVGAGALVTGGTEVPSGSLALGVPAKIRAAGADPSSISVPVESYRRRARRFASELERVDYDPAQGLQP